ncbi:CDC73-domain-containing protein [Parathielavia appendiculata]|uniref:CDC73-domain-containing protein n=1 Tax=Parathielavia appendiculata TaxID=2587402 RepID=A0AAN6U704_9PEZI|nr:CDC73-domain-containing protein [Parathielavia appendiculata]
MASTEDPLLLLRQSIAADGKIIPTTSPDSSEEAPLSKATHLVFTHPTRIAVPIDAPTRFTSTEGKAVDVRSIYFAWLNRDFAIPEYNAVATKLNEEMAGATAVHMFAFVERLVLFTFLEGAQEESEFIKPLPGDKDVATGVGAAAAGVTLKAAPAALGRSGRGTLDPRLAQIYNGERRMGDRNTILRGIKPTDFSHVRKLASPFMTRKPGGPPLAAGVGANPSLPLNQKPARRPDPIILLSPSASALLRMSNAKTFLEGGRYTPPDHNSTSTMLHISRIIKDIDPSRPMRFILVEGPEQFKPEYWNRVVAVFTTGQAWQFKNYRWSNPAELFKHVLGVYLGWRGEEPPESVRAFGHKVLACSVEKWRDPGQPGAETSRWRDREVVEAIWKAIEANMRAKGWRKDAAPSSI